MAAASLLGCQPPDELDVEVTGEAESALADTYSNWYSGGGRGAEQGTHGTGMGDCPAGSVVVGVQYFEGGNSDWVDGVGITCGSPVNGATTSNWYSGGARGAEQGTHGTGMGLCPAGMLVSGIQYFEGGNADWVDGVGVTCRSPATGAIHQSNWYSGGARGAEQGTHGTGMGLCPGSQFVVGVQYFEGGNADWVDGLGVHCADLPYCVETSPLTCVTIPAAADTFLSADHPTWAPGDQVSLWSGVSSGGALNVPLFRFDLSAIPATARVDSASFQVVAAWSEHNNAVNVHAVLADWSETATTAANFPYPAGVAATPTGSFLAGGGGWKSVDVTDLASGWHDGSIANHGLTLVEPAVASHLYYSREAGAASSPELEVCYVTCAP